MKHQKMRSAKILVGKWLCMRENEYKHFSQEKVQPVIFDEAYRMQEILTYR